MEMTHTSLLFKLRPSTCQARLMFDYPSPGAIAKYAAAQLAPSAAPALPVIRAPVADERGPLAALSTACHFPADGDDSQTFWAALVGKTDGVTEIPYDRWDVDEYYDAAPGTVGRMYVRHAAFVKNAECFDAALFSISGAEAGIFRHVLAEQFPAFYMHKLR